MISMVVVMDRGEPLLKSEVERIQVYFRFTFNSNHIISVRIPNSKLRQTYLFLLIYIYLTFFLLITDSSVELMTNKFDVSIGDEFINYSINFRDTNRDKFYNTIIIII